jgi:type II secretory pathway pseudopilin PulG
MNRPGATLIEALVAIFIMAIGLLTLLTLFPLGALNMAQAIQDDRAAHAAANAIALAAARNLRNDPVVIGTDFDRFWYGCGNGLPKAKRQSRSYPIYVDPFGVVLGSITVADLPQGIPRQTVSWLSADQGMQAQYQNLSRGFTVLDDMKFIKDGRFRGLPTRDPNQDWVERWGQYSWAYLLCRPKAGDPTVVDLSVVVYCGRLVQLPMRETPYYPVVFDVNTSFVRVPWDPSSQERPPVRKGSWVLDATIPPDTSESPHGFFYRVVGVSDEAPNVAVLELQRKPKVGTSNGTLIVMENVVEVFDKGIGWQP